MSNTLANDVRLVDVFDLEDVVLKFLGRIGVHTVAAAFAKAHANRLSLHTLIWDASAFSLDHDYCLAQARVIEQAKGGAA